MTHKDELSIEQLPEDIDLRLAQLLVKILEDRHKGK